MIGTFDVKITTENPNLPLRTFRSFVGSPSSVRVTNVPSRIGTWDITKVFLAVSYPDNTIRTDECVLVQGLWLGSLPASESAGMTASGFQITASGTDENGNPVSGYVLGVGDVEIFDRDSTIEIGGTTYYLHLVDSVPTVPHKGDVMNGSDGWLIFDGSQWTALGGARYTAGEGLRLDGTVFSLSAVIPRNVSELSNDAGYLTQHQSLANYATIAFANGLVQPIVQLIPTEASRANKLADKAYVLSAVPTKVSQLANDANYATKTWVNSALTPIQTVIPTEASYSNKLADKAYVSSVISSSLGEVECLLSALRGGV